MFGSKYLGVPLIGLAIAFAIAGYRSSNAGCDTTCVDNQVCVWWELSGAYWKIKFPVDCGAYYWGSDNTHYYLNSGAGTTKTAKMASTLVSDLYCAAHSGNGTGESEAPYYWESSVSCGSPPTDVTVLCRTCSYAK